MRRWLLRLLGGVPREDLGRAYVRVLDANGAWVQSSQVLNQPLPDGRDCFPVRVRRLQ